MGQGKERAHQPLGGPVTALFLREALLVGLVDLRLRMQALHDLGLLLLDVLFVEVDVVIGDLEALLLLVDLVLFLLDALLVLELEQVDLLHVLPLDQLEAFQPDAVDLQLLLVELLLLVLELVVLLLALDCLILVLLDLYSAAKRTHTKIR